MASRSLFPFGSGGAPAERSGYTDPFLTLHREMNRLFDDIWRGFGAPAAVFGQATAPRMDVSETDKEIKICAEMPGVSEKDIDVTLEDDVLTIRGQRKQESEEKEQNYHVMERSYGSFARSVRLPFSAKPEEVKASFENGLLTITLPKSEAQQKARRIEVKPGGGGETRVLREAAGDKPQQAQSAADIKAQERPA